MPRPCSICKSNNRAEIDAALVSRSLRDIALQWGFSKDALARHKAHLSALIQAAEPESVLRSAEAIRGGMEKLLARADAITTRAETEEDSATALKGIAEARRIYEAAARLLLPVDLTTRLERIEERVAYGTKHQSNPFA